MGLQRFSSFGSARRREVSICTRGRPNDRLVFNDFENNSRPAVSRNRGHRERWLRRPVAVAAVPSLSASPNDPADWYLALSGGFRHNFLGMREGSNLVMVFVVGFEVF